MKIPNLREMIWISPPDLGGENISSIMRRYMEFIGWKKGENPCLIYVGSESQIEKGIEAREKYPHIPFILNFWGWMPERFIMEEWRKHYNKKINLIQEYADRITVPSVQAVEQLMILGITKPVYINFPGVDILGLLVSKIESKKYLDTESFIISIGRLVRHKNFQAVINALEGTGFKYIIIGSGECKEELVRLAKEKKVDLIIQENVNDKRKAELVSLARALVVPSSYEGFGLPIVEGATLSTPVIASNLPVFRELFGDNLEYFIDSRDLRDKIKMVMEYEYYRKEIITKEAILALKYSALTQSISLNHLFMESVSWKLKDVMRIESDRGDISLAEVYNFDAMIDKEYFTYRLDPNTPLFFFRGDPLLKNLSGKTVLDVGSSTGTFSIYMAGAGYEITCIDIAEKYLQIVKVLAESNGFTKNITTKLCDATKLEGVFEAESFDNVWAGEIIEHFEDSKILIVQLMRVLKTGGRFLLTVPYKNACHDAFHLKEFNNEEDIKAIFKEFPKFEFKEIKKVGSPGGEYNNWFAWGIKNA